MSGKATLYFVVTKVTAPKSKSFNLVLSVGDSKVTLGSPKTRGSNYTLPYKISKEVTSLADGSYRSCAAQINFLDGETISSTGSCRIKPDDFKNVSNIDVKEYNISVPNVEGVTAFIGISLIPEGGAAPSNYGEFGDSAKVISTESRLESDSGSHHSHHRSSQPEQPPAEGQMEGAEEIVESESGRKHRRKRGTKDKEDGTFVSDGGTTHKRRHRSHTTQPAAPPPVETAPPPAPEPTPEGQMEGAEEIVESESGRKHRRKRGTKDKEDGTFVSDGGTTHKRRHRHKTEEPKPEEPKPEPPKQEEPKPEPPKQEEPKPEPPKQEEPKPEPPKQEEPKPEPPKQEEPKPEPPKSEEIKQEESNSNVQRSLQIDEAQNLTTTEEAENPQLAKQVSDLVDAVQKQTNWIHSLYSKLNEHGISQSLKPNDPRFANLPKNITDFSRTLRPQSLKVGEAENPMESPSIIENDLQKACQTGEYDQNSFQIRARNISGNGVNNIEDEMYENPNDNYDDGPLRHFHFAKNEIKEPEEPIFSTSDGLTLSYSIRNDCFFRPHYNFEMLDISGRFSFEVFQSPFEIEEESLSIECRYNPTIEYNSGDGGYQDIPTFSPTRSRFQTEIKGRSYFVNENQNNDQYSLPRRNYEYEPRRVISPTKNPNTQLRISNQDENDITNNDDSRFTFRNQTNYGQRINDDFHSAFYNSTDRYSAPKKRTGFNYPDSENNFNPDNEEIIPNENKPIERNIEIDFQDQTPLSNSSNSFNANPNSSPNFSPSSSQNLNSQPLLLEQQNQLKQKIQEQMQKQQKQLQKQMDELHQMRKELTEQTQQMQEQMAIQMQQQMQIQQQNIQNMQLTMEKKKQMMQLELEKERKQMNNSKQLLELQMEREKDLMEKERAKMEKERQTLRQQRLLQEEELLQLKNQRELQQKEMQQLQRLQDLHKQQQQELQEQQEQHIQQRKELQQQQQSLSPSFNQQTDIEQPQQNSIPTYMNRQIDPQQQQSFSPSSLNQQLDPQQQQPFQQDDSQSLNQEQLENFNLGGSGNQAPPFPPQGSNKSRQFDCRIFTDETIYVPPKRKQEQQNQNQPFSKDKANDFSSFSSNIQPVHDSDSNSAINSHIIIQEEEEEVENGEPFTQTNEFDQNDAKKGPTVALLNRQVNGDATTSQFQQPTQDNVNFNQEASLTQSSNDGIFSEAVDNNNNNNNNYPQTQYVSLDDDDINVVLHRSNTDVSNKNINKILTFDKSTAPPLLNQAQEASPILKQQQGRKVKSTNNFDPRNLSGFDNAENDYNNSNRNEANDDNDELLFQNLDQDQNNNQFYPRPTDLKITKNIVA